MTGGQWLGIVLMLGGVALIGSLFVLDALWLMIGAVLGGLALLIVGALLTFTDNPHHLHDGYVVGKKFTPAHTAWTTQCTPAGKTTICHPQPIFVDDDWALKLRKCDDERKCVNGTLHFDDSARYDQYEVGDYYPAGVR